MKKYITNLLLFFFCTLPIKAHTTLFSPHEPYLISTLQEAKTAFLVKEDGNYQIEIFPLVRFEFSVILRDQEGNWVVLATNRTASELSSFLEVHLKKDTVYFFIAQLPPKVVLPLQVILKRNQFVELKNNLKKELSPYLTDSFPLRERLSFHPPGRVEEMSAAWTDNGEFFVAISDSEKRAVHLWSVTKKIPLGRILSQGDARIASFALTVSPKGEPLLAWQESGSNVLSVRLWEGTSGKDQPPLDQAKMPFQWLPQGPVLLFQGESQMLQAALWQPSGWKKVSKEPWSVCSGPTLNYSLSAIVYQNQVTVAVIQNEEKIGKIYFLEKGKIWSNAENPQVRGCQATLLAVNSDTFFYAQKHKEGYWTFYRYKNHLNWQMIPSPQDLSPKANLKLCVNSGSIWLSELSQEGLNLRQLIDFEWKPPLRIKNSFATQLQTVLFLDPPSNAKTKTIVILKREKTADKIQVYDLP